MEPDKGTPPGTTKVPLEDTAWKEEITIGDHAIPKKGMDLSSQRGRVGGGRGEGGGDEPREITTGDVSTEYARVINRSTNTGVAWGQLVSVEAPFYFRALARAGGGRGCSWGKGGAARGENWVGYMYPTVPMQLCTGCAVEATEWMPSTAVRM